MFSQSTFAVYIVIMCMVFDRSSGLVCPYGWQSNRDRTACIMDCDGQRGSTSKKNINCQLPSMTDSKSHYYANDNKLTTRPGKSLLTSSKTVLPSCYNVTLTFKQFNQSREDEFQLNYNIPPIYSYNLDSRDNSSITVCYPLSPQLQQCEIVATKLGRYQVVNGTTLIIPSRNITTYLGDFYIDDNGVAYTCSQGINVSLYSYPRCNYVTLRSDEYKLHENGSMFIYKANFTIRNPVYSFVNGEHTQVCIPLSIDFLICPIKLAWPPFNYVIDSNLTATNTLLQHRYKPNHYFIKSDESLVLCLESGVSRNNELLITFYTVHVCLYIASACCLIIIAILKFKFYMKNYHTKCLFFHIASLLVVYLTWTFKRFGNATNIVSCYALFTITYYSYMSAFFWLNVIAYDSWRNFTRMQTAPYRCYCITKYLKLSNNRSRFILYNLYAWGMAFLLTVITLTVELAPMPRNVMFLNPQISYLCWFNNYDSTIVFYLIPLSIVMLVNIIFFILTVNIIHYVSRGTELVTKRRKQIFKVAGKLIIVMGLCWTILIICYCLTKFETENFKFWYISNAVQGAQGILISVIYLTKAKAFKSFCTRLHATCFSRKNNELPQQKPPQSSSSSSKVLGTATTSL